MLAGSGGGVVEASTSPGAAPTVIFENGLGAYKEEWKEIYPVISSSNATFSYDRPGTGRSSATSRRRDGATIVEDLRGMLRDNGIKPPYVLVGHSAGGLYMQLFARLHPDEVAGLVLVDPTHPKSFEGAGALANRGGLAVAAMSAASLFGSIRTEFDALAETGREVAAAPPLPASTPTRIIVAPDPSGGAAAAFDNANRADFARLYPQAAIIAVGGGHDVPATHPEVVISAIRDVLATSQAH